MWCAASLRGFGTKEVVGRRMDNGACPWSKCVDDLVQARLV